MLAWACVVGILGLSAPTSCSSKFFYSKSTGQKPDECRLCFEKDCMTLEKARCDYYAAADSLLPKDVEEKRGIEDADKRKEVDELIHDLVEKELSNTMECIPYVSRYTNCNKDNVCLGCKSCDCKPDGRWNCNTTQPCHSQDHPLNIDHRILVMIMEALSDSAHLKKTKRSVIDQSEEIKNTDVTDHPSTLSFVKLSDWLYAVTALKETRTTDDTTTEFSVIVPEDDIVTEAEITTTETDASSTPPRITPTEAPTEASTFADADYVAFDEVLRNIAVDSNNYNRRKPLDNALDNETFSIDYMIMDEENATSGTPNYNVMNFTLEYDDVTPESILESATKVVIDLLETASKLGATANVTQDYTNFNKDDDRNFFDNSNDILEYNALNIMKRDVTGQENITAPIEVNSANTTNENIIQESIDLNEKVLIPLKQIIAEKIKEFENLLEIKENLLKFVNRGRELPDDTSNETNTYFYIHNLTMVPTLNVNARRSNLNKYDRYMLKLKNHIFDVIRDIVAIQNYRGTEAPKDLKILMRAMRGYVYRNQLVEAPRRTFSIGPTSFRRNMEQTSSRCYHLSFKDCLFQIVEVIDKDSPKSNALFPLSPTSRKIIKHFIKSYYAEHVMPGLQIRNPHYNLTHYINSIGAEWKGLMSNFISYMPFASLHRMKLLHCIITLDISKMKDGLKLLEFARNRRMVSSLDQVNEDTIDEIEAGLVAIHNKVRLLIQYYQQMPQQPETNYPQAEVNETTTERPAPTTIIIPVVTRKKKSHSFIKLVRRILKASEKDITKFLHRDVSKSEIVKQLAKKRLKDMSDKRYGEYEETMKRWQENLELIPRVKRSILNQFKTRTKNIIPRYLTRKVNPRIKVIREKGPVAINTINKEGSRRGKNSKQKRKQYPDRKHQRHSTRHAAATSTAAAATTAAAVTRASTASIIATAKPH